MQLQRYTDIIYLIISYISISIVTFFSHLYLTREGDPIFVLGLLVFSIYLLTVFGYYILKRIDIEEDLESVLVINFSTFGLFISAICLSLAELISEDLYLFSETTVSVVVGITTGLVILILGGSIFVTSPLRNN